MTTTTSAPVDVVPGVKPRRAGLMVAGGLVAVLAVVVGLVAIAAQLFGGGSPTKSAAAGSAAGAPGAATDSIRAARAAPAPPADLTLPQPSGYTDGVPVGYPDTEAGAVAAAYGYSRIATGLDVPATLRTVEAFADPASGWFARSRAQIADALVAQRQELGLAASGPDTGAVLNVNPSGYQIAAPLSAGRITVLTLDVISGQSTSGTVTSGQVVLRWALHWAGNRWLVTQLFADKHDDSLAAVPFTSDAQAKGWREATGG
jgi:hypothetical protein